MQAKECGPSRDTRQRGDGQGFGGGGSVPSCLPSAEREARVAGFTPLLMPYRSLQWPWWP